MIGPPGKRGAPSAESAPLRTAAEQDREPLDTTLPAFRVSGVPADEISALEAIYRAIEEGRVAPTTADFAEIIGCESLSTPTAVLKRLQLRGKIFVESYHAYRRIWVPDGRSTAKPPSTCPNTRLGPRNKTGELFKRESGGGLQKGLAS